MARQVHNEALADLTHFIDPVGKLIAPVFYMDLRFPVWNIPAVHICNSRHNLILNP
jgi:hypothetical protein